MKQKFFWGRGDHIKGSTQNSEGKKKRDKSIKGMPHVKFTADVPRKSSLIFLD